MRDRLEIWRSGVGVLDRPSTRKGRAGQMGTDQLGLGAAGRSYGAAAPSLLHKLAFATPALVLHLHLHRVARRFLGKTIVSSCCFSASCPLGLYLLHVVCYLAIFASAASQCCWTDQGIQFRTEFLHAWEVEKSADRKSDSLLTSLLFFLYYPIRNLVRLVSSRSVPFGAFGPDYMYSP
ncbi:hypothetical protein DTO271G3_8797 [Paecilomyces variotii]|nr:hypothetical protein DTO271G3_8797 [Paecilomyces variotii]